MAVHLPTNHRPVRLTAITGLGAMQPVHEIAAPATERTPTCTQSTGLTKSANGSLVECWFGSVIVTPRIFGGPGTHGALPRAGGIRKME